MRNQKGQSAVEFAIILPLFFTLVLAVLYSGIMFMDYIQFSNAARAAARDIALASNKTDNNGNNNGQEIINKLNEQDETYIKKYAVQLTSLYTATFDVNPKTLQSTDVRVIVTVNFTRNDENFPNLLYEMNFPPKNLGSITYTMPLEKEK